MLDGAYSRYGKEEKWLQADILHINQLKNVEKSKNLKYFFYLIVHDCFMYYYYSIKIITSSF
jgi:hypothetical protein